MASRAWSEFHSAMRVRPGRVQELSLGLLNLFAAGLVAVGVFIGLPARYAPVDAGALLLTLGLAASAAGQLGGFRWAAHVTLVVSGVTLALGLSVVAALALSVSYLTGIYGPAARGGALILGLVAALAVPYLVALPAFQLVWAGRIRQQFKARERARAEQRSAGAVDLSV